MNIFSFSGTITPLDDKTNIVHKFTVPAGTKAIKIDFSYSPKVFENKEKAIEIINNSLQKYDCKDRKPEEFLPLTNLLTLSVDEGEKYRGAAHRPAEKSEHIIGKDFASYGFNKGKIRDTDWAVTINVHCALENIQYSIKISGEAEK